MSWFVQAIGKDANLFEGRWSEPVRQSTSQKNLARMDGA
jgi:hypothetical protein